MSVYYVDYSSSVSGDGLLESSPASSVSLIPVKSGDTVLIRCNSFYRGMLETVENVSYGTYGDGKKPVFCGSVDVSSPDCWESLGNNIWRCTKKTTGGVGNFVFDYGKSCGTYRWEKSALTSQGDFYDGRPVEDDVAFNLLPSEYELLMYSVENPGSFYTHVEAVCFGKRKLADAKNGTSFDGIRFINSGVHGLQGMAENVTVRNCDFEFIGGCPWSKKLKIRFGNAIEFYDVANNILIENCTFRSVYDSCITYQGNAEHCRECDSFICRNNVFDSYGMAAFEYRDKLPMFSAFESNICLNAGCGFAMQGEEIPRRSEIWPEPMGHHIFLWRIASCRYEKGLKIANNRFEGAPVGASIYSVISEEAEKGIDLSGNSFDVSNQMLIAHINNKNYTDIGTFRKEIESDASVL